MLNLYSFFHLNLMFSSIEEETRPEVVEKCYWPLLDLIETHDFKTGVELTFSTLKIIADIDQNSSKFKWLPNQGYCDLIGSGYSQLIGPLVPVEVNMANQLEGVKGYHELLGIRPNIALVNEQAYSAGLVNIYKDAGYSSLIMEWNNPYSQNLDRSSELQYFPQQALGFDGTS